MARVRRRARTVLFGGALVAALAADIWYDIFSFWFFRFFRIRLGFPLFFLVALAVFAVIVARRTRTLPLSSRLDGRFALKGRLVSAFLFARLSGVPADLREAQARETLRVVDFRRLRASFRLRPWGALAFLVTGAGFTAWLMYRYPESFSPSNVAFRQGRVVFMAVKNLGDAGGRDGAESPGNAPRRDDDSHPQVALIPEKGSAKTDSSPGAETGSPTGEKPTPGGGKGSQPEAEQPGKKPRSHPETADDESTRRADGDRGRKGARPGPGAGGTGERPLSIEETAAVSPLAARPEEGLTAGSADPRVPGGRPALPPLPFFRLVGVGAQQKALFDPETLNIVLDAYPPKYRAHLEAYLKALQSLWEDRHGS